ncbi:hypothetical protein BDR26DRAFT_917541 [Obelidium mucronatum]|nr:hypothetical protein BDR26DRAFT_917541 [Obelidium mucronatum]
MVPPSYNQVIAPVLSPSELLTPAQEPSDRDGHDPTTGNNDRVRLTILREAFRFEPDPEPVTIIETAETRHQSSISSPNNRPSANRDPISRTTCQFQIRYDNFQGKLFQEVMPEALHGTIPTHVFFTRMQHINHELAQFKTLKDYTPVIRSAILHFYVFGGLVPVFLGAKIVALIWWSFGIALICMVIIATYFFHTGAVNKFLLKQVQAFNEVDANVHLHWKLLPVATNLPVFVYDWKDVGIQVDWIIVVQHIRKEQEEVEFLPAYSQEHSVAIDLDVDSITIPHSGGKPPSYRSFVLRS